MVKQTSLMKRGAVFAVPLEQSGFGVGQIIQTRDTVVRSFACVFFSTKLDSLSDLFDVDRLGSSQVSLQYVTPNSLKMGSWQIISIEDPVLEENNALTSNFLRTGSIVGERVYGCGVMTQFLSAWHGQLPWDLMFDSEFFDKLLLDDVIKPNSVFYKDE